MTNRNSEDGEMFRDLHDDFLGSFQGPRLFNDKDLITIPSVNVTENKQQFGVKLAAPGFKKDDFKVEVKGRVLTISSDKEVEKEEEGKNYIHREYSYSAFSDSFHLPANVQEEDVKATYENGELRIIIPRGKTHSKAKTRGVIPVK